MAYFEDLSINTYTSAAESGRLSVGWLAEGKPFHTGRTSEAFRSALDDLCRNHAKSFCFGYHVCEFCPDGSVEDSYFTSMGNGEIEIRSANGTWYVAPCLIIHYVAEHDYCPPSEFIEAVLNPSEIGKDPEPTKLTEEEEVKRIREWERQRRENAGPPIDVDAIVRQALKRKPWWRFW